MKFIDHLKGAAFCAALILLLSADLGPVTRIQILSQDETLTADVVTDEGTEKILSLSTPAPNVVSGGNSTTSTLGSGATFTGSWEEILKYSSISVLINSDQDSAADGLKVEWSADGSTIHSNDLFSYSAAVGKQYTFGTPARYFRLRYTNGGTGQGSFTLQTIYHRVNLKHSSHRLTDSLDDEDDAELTKSVITGKSNESGDYVNVAVTDDGTLPITLAPGGTIVPTLGTALSYDDMNASNGGIPRETSVTAGSPGNWVQLYTYSGSGLLMGFLTTLQNLNGTASNYWQIRLVIDGNDLFGSAGISMRDMSHNQTYNWNTGSTPSPTWGGLNLVQDTFRWDAPNNLPVTFESSVTIYIRRIGSADRDWRAGIVCIVKES